MKINVCIIDEHGAFILSKIEWFSSICDVRVGEALKLFSNINWVHDLNMR